MNSLPAVGTLFLDPESGIAYRLRSYGTNWHSEPFDPTPTVPSYSTLGLSGGSSAAESLPVAAVVVWSPPAAGAV
ncbi:hypothetical protein [Aeromicrobium endophyticum]|uniref:Uncharacterized protein n=1 Tax=Aeromicrobium endophyticum TaxID=2292704 RepID=A0A371PCL8_9ACTN|nr:hypothetical protein [Aeromicrobium endophyticum]REK73673.1 hypothetical protein DX116_09115 [Aeromicrobium endophyticum]